MNSQKPAQKENHHLRFLQQHAHLSTTFGDNWMALKAEAFARFFGTPGFLISQTVIVVGWIIINTSGAAHFDLYPFILLNLAFSLQAAYAAPLILLAQTRQAERDKAHSAADAKHREEIAVENRELLAHTTKQTTQLLLLVEQNTKLTETTKELSQKIADLTSEIHKKLVP